jgi:hypothetical protein
MTQISPIFSQIMQLDLFNDLNLNTSLYGYWLDVCMMYDMFNVAIDKKSLRCGQYIRTHKKVEFPSSIIFYVHHIRDNDIYLVQLFRMFDTSYDPTYVSSFTKCQCIILTDTAVDDTSLYSDDWHRTPTYMCIKDCSTMSDENFQAISKYSFMSDSCQYAKLCTNKSDMVDEPQKKLYCHMHDYTKSKQFVFRNNLDKLSYNRAMNRIKRERDILENNEREFIEKAQQCRELICALYRDEHAVSQELAELEKEYTCGNYL